MSYSNSTCFAKSNANPAFQPRFGTHREENPATTKKGFTSIGYLNTDWVNPNVKVEGVVQDPPFPCQLFYGSMDHGEIDMSCWQCIRGEILKVQNLESKDAGSCSPTDMTCVEKAKQNTSCISNPCANLTMYSDVDLPSPEEFCAFAQCVKENRSTCGDDLFYAVFGSDKNAELFSMQKCTNSFSSSLPSSSLPPVMEAFSSSSSSPFSHGPWKEKYQQYLFFTGS